jgi:uncharacterized tellurite resistance protein B-like protein
MFDRLIGRAGAGLQQGMRRWWRRSASSRRDVACDAAQAARLQACYGLLGALAGVDGRVVPAELTQVAALMDRESLAPPARRLALAAFESGRSNALSPAAEVELLLRLRDDGHARLGRLLDDLIDLACSDGRVHAAERAWLTAFARRLNMDEAGLALRMRSRRPAIARSA